VPRGAGRVHGNTAALPQQAPRADSGASEEMTPWVWARGMAW
jgi:hypothetical protein